jgi:hypothetical protein
VGAVVQSGTLDITNAESIDFQLGNVAAGSGYTITITSSSDGGVTCTGSGGPFSVAGHATTSVLVNMACYAPGTDAGNVAVNGAPYLCATWNSLATVDPAHQGTSGSEANVGSSITLIATATGPDPRGLTYTWSSSVAIGTFGQDVVSNGGTEDTTTFLCTSPGTTTITLVVGDGMVPDGGSCDPSQSTVTIEVTCDAPPTAFDRVDFVVSTGGVALTQDSAATITLQTQAGPSQTFVVKDTGQPAWKANTTHTASFALSPTVRACDITSATVTLVPPSTIPAGVAPPSWAVRRLKATLSVDESDKNVILDTSGSPLALLTGAQPMLQEATSCSTGPTLFARLGGEPAAVAASNDFIDRITNDSRLAQVVATALPTPASVAAAKSWIASEICVLGGGGCSLPGPSPFASAVQSTDEFIAFVNDLTASMAQFSSATVSDKNELLGAPLVGDSTPVIPGPPAAPASSAGIVDSEIQTPQYVNLYWDSSWDADNPAVPREALDSFMQGVLDSSYFSGLSEYGIGAPTFLGSTLPNSACTQVAPPFVGFYDPVNASIIGFLNCELDNDSSVPQGDDVIYNIMLPQGSTEVDAIAPLLGQPFQCTVSGSATGWHFHGTPYATGAFLGGLIGGLITIDPLFPFGALAGFLAAWSLEGGPYYTISSAAPGCGNLTNNEVHEMVEAASDPRPSFTVLASGGTDEIVDLCNNQFSTSFVPTPPVGTTLSPGGFLGSQVPLYELDSNLSCVPGFDTTAPTPTIVGVTMSGSFPTTTVTITGSGFGTLPASVPVPTVGLLPYIGFQDTDAGWQAGNSLNSNSVLMTITSWDDGQITISEFSPPSAPPVGMSVGDNLVLWVCNPSSGACDATTAISTVSGGGPNDHDIMSIQVTIETGSDNARADSELWITVGQAALAATMCLKPSNNASSDAICNNGGTARDQNGNQEWHSPSTDGPQTFPNPAAPDQAFTPSPHLGTMDVRLISHRNGTEGDDNWNIQGIQVVGIQRNMVLQQLLTISPSSDQSNCVARLKAAPNAATVRFTLDGTTNGHIYVGGTSTEQFETTTCSNNGG